MIIDTQQGDVLDTINALPDYASSAPPRPLPIRENVIIRGSASAGNNPVAYGTPDVREVDP